MSNFTKVIKSNQIEVVDLTSQVVAEKLRVVRMEMLGGSSN
jgi:hypothetical protein